jgi:arylsulfatase A-like enzyme
LPAAASTPNFRRPLVLSSRRRRVRRVRWRLQLGILCLLAVLALACRPDAPAPRNLIIISVDTLRADHLAVYGSERNLTPHLDRLAKQSIVFEHAYATAPFTLASVASLLSGRYPEEVGIEWNQSVLAPEIPMLANVLSDAGWWTQGVVSNFVLRRKKSGIHAGFGHYDDSFPQREIVRGYPERDAGATTEAAIAALDTFESRANIDAQPLFLWVHYQDPHGPYTPGESMRASFYDRERHEAEAPNVLPVSDSARGIGAIPNYQFLEGRRDKEFYRAGYEGEIKVVDAAIGRLLKTLTARSYLERSLVIFTADHGESLGEDDYWFSHGEFLNDALMRVPLFFRFPGGRGDSRTDVASLVDVFATALVTFGLPHAATSGRNLFASEAESAARPIYFANLKESSTPRYGMVDRGYRYLVTPRLPGSKGELGPRREQLHLVEGSRADSVSLAKERPDVAAAMRAQLLEARRAFDRASPTKRTQDLTGAERQQLESLGYMGEADEATK